MVKPLPHPPSSRLEKNNGSGTYWITPGDDTKTPFCPEPLRLAFHHGCPTCFNRRAMTGVVGDVCRRSSSAATVNPKPPRAGRSRSPCHPWSPTMTSLQTLTPMPMMVSALTSPPPHNRTDSGEASSSEQDDPHSQAGRPPARGKKPPSGSSTHATTFPTRATIHSADTPPTSAKAVPKDSNLPVQPTRVTPAASPPASRRQRGPAAPPLIIPPGPQAGGGLQVRPVPRKREPNSPTDLSKEPPVKRESSRCRWEKQ